MRWTLLCSVLLCGCARTDTIAHDDCDSSDPRAYVVLNASPLVDGDLSDWEGACVIEIASRSTAAVGSYRMVWDETALYLAAQVADSRLHATLTTRDSEVWREDSVETMFDTDADGGAESMPRLDDYKLLVNLLGTVGDAQGGRDPRAAWDMTLTTRVELNGSLNDTSDDQGYVIELSAPWSSWGVDPPEAEKEWGFDIVLNDKVGDGDAVQTHWANPTDDTNVPDYWGRALFLQRRP